MSVTPEFIGQRYKDTNTGNIWIANSTTPGDWSLELQNMQVQWEPTGVNFGELIGYFTYGDLPTITEITFLGSTDIAGFDIEYLSNLASISFPNLVSIDPTNSQFGYMSITDAPVLTLVSLPSLTVVGNGVRIQVCDALTSISLPLFVGGASGNVTLDCRNNLNLATVSIPNLMPTNGTYVIFSGCALTQASVDHILARCVANAAYVSGTVSLQGGTNATPSAAGLIDKATLIGRGCTVTTN